jgi:hypothetical protein
MEVVSEEKRKLVVSNRGNQRSGVAPAAEPYPPATAIQVSEWAMRIPTDCMKAWRPVWEICVREVLQSARKVLQSARKVLQSAWKSGSLHGSLTISMPDSLQSLFLTVLSLSISMTDSLQSLSLTVCSLYARQSAVYRKPDSLHGRPKVRSLAVSSLYGSLAVSIKG